MSGVCHAARTASYFHKIISVSEGMNPNEMTWAAYERTLRAAKKSPRTIQSYQEAFDLLAAFHDGADVTDLGKVDIQEFIIDQLARHTASTAGVRFRSLRAFYNFCVREEIIDGASPLARMKEPKPTDKPPSVLDDDQLKTLLSSCSGKTYDDRRDTAIIRLWCEPGSARVSEMAGITVDDLDMRRSLVRLHGKRDKIRLIPFGAKTGTALDRFLRQRSKHPLAAKTDRLWLGARGMSLTSSGLYQMLIRRAGAAGIGHANPHQLRHTSAHQWKLDGGSDDEAMALFGWDSPAMPLVYGRSARVERAHRTSRRISPADRL